MTPLPAAKPDLSAAYALQGPDDVRRLYDAWADTYDAEFATRMDYVLPAQVARAYMARGGTGPVLDVGAGTGLLGAALRAMGFGAEIDGIDLSPPMLDRAARRGIYRHLIAGDATGPMGAARFGPYAGVVSSGTFTQGHLGPGALIGLARAHPGALFALSVNAAVWKGLGFADALAALATSDLRVTEAPIYGQGADDPVHAADRAMIVTFRAGQA